MNIKLTTCPICKNLAFCIIRDSFIFCKKCYEERFGNIKEAQNTCSNCGKISDDILILDSLPLCPTCKENLEADQSHINKLMLAEKKRLELLKHGPPKTVYINPKDILWKNPKEQNKTSLPPGYYVKKYQGTEQQNNTNNLYTQPDEQYYSDLENAGYAISPFQETAASSICGGYGGPSTSIHAQNDNKRTISAKVKREVWRRDQGKCAICGSNSFLEFDHIIPYSKGGQSTSRNIQLLCQTCNRKKYNKM